MLRTAVEEKGGEEVNTEGDALFAAFPSAREALGAAVAAQRTIVRHPWPGGAAVRVRMGLHTGEARVAEGGYVGMDVHRAARIAAAGHGGQTLLSDTTCALVTKDLPDDVSLHDLGEHRLKDLTRPHRLFQVLTADLPSDFPPLRSLNVRAHNLPIQLTSFIGREKEMAEIKRLLSTANLITLSGAGGAGKTRLALQVAADVVEDYPNGVWLAEFASIADPALVPKTVAAALSLPEQPGRDITATLVDALRSRALLVVLDNCEHLLAACADLAAALLRTCGQVHILATSREGLGVPGETIWRVPSLSLPDVGGVPAVADLVLSEAVRVFADRAAATAPGFAVTSQNAAAVAQVCRRLDGIPLAIELAAARVKVLSVEQIARRLDDRFRLLTGGSRTNVPRQQTLRAALDWSYDLLDQKEQALLRRASVFAGGWALEAAESVCAGDGLEPSDILDLLTHLVDKSLVIAETRSSEARYLLLETVRQYGLNKLFEAGEAANVRQRHRDWFLAVAKQAEPILHGPQQRIWADRLRTEHDNMRAAFEWSMTEVSGRREGLGLATALSDYLRISGHWSELHTWLEEALKHDKDVTPAMRAKALAHAAHAAWRVGKDERAIELAEEGLVVCREVGDREYGAACFLCLADVAMQRGDNEQAKRFASESLNLASGLEDKFVASVALSYLGETTRYQGDYERATVLHQQSLDVAKRVGAPSWTANVLRHLGMDHLRRGDYQQATAYYKHSLRMCQEGGNRWVPVECLNGLGDIACVERRYERAVRLFGAASQLRETLGFRFNLSDQECHAQYTASTRACLEAATFALAWAEGRAMTLEQAIEYAVATATEV